MGETDRDLFSALRVSVGENTRCKVSALSSVPKTRDPLLLGKGEDFPLRSVYMYVCVCSPLVNILALKLSTVYRKASKPCL